MHNRLTVYRRLLRLYPKAYREEYAEQMVQTLSDMLDDQLDGSNRMLITCQAYGSLPFTIFNQNALAVADNLMNQTPGYIKRNGAVAALLLVPTLLVLATNSLNMAINHHSMQTSWLWSRPLVAAWAIILPAAAFLLGLASYAVYAASRSDASLLKRLSDVKQTWPVVLAGICGLALLLLVLFHDSAHCWVQNPVHTVTHLQQTWQCTTEGFLGGS
jgi:hypothetical protein